MSAAPKRHARLFTPSSDFREAFDRKPFALEHALGNHPLFELSRLARLGETILSKGDPQNFSHFGGEGISAGTRLPTREPKRRVSDAIEQLGTGGSWIKLTAAQEIDPEYSELLDNLIIELEGLTGQPLRQTMTWKSATIFVASPGTFTPYHIDHNHNFLLQIRGTKEFNVFHPSDRAVLSEEEIEEFYAGDDSAAKYKPESQPKALVYHLEPGMGVYQPSIAPHWVRNGNEPTIALSVGFCLRPLDKRGRVYQVNHYLRRLRLHPTPLGRSRLKDRAKILAIGLISTRRPKNYRETIYSGVERIRSLVRLGRTFAGRRADRPKPLP
jgi:cupin-like protein